MFISAVRRAAQNKASLFLNNHFKSRTVWPPDFSKLDAKQKFRYERKFKRRSKLKWLRPGWVKGVKIAQFTSIVFVLIYGVLFLDLSSEGSPRHRPFAGIRSWFFGMTENIFGTDDKRRNLSLESQPTSSATPGIK
ncbi:hypothetical protein GcC1_221015 [Golovinomyces cichoracearum]|uniref:Uncharacterized protein n=1 Tax=Golovinomyces cichoracearum TaxID=62708 RepID=A0A420H7G7_9PEZI|nr:hypothetical protein GcC1_221015 [Golovinomyces cichoracearum]